MQRGQGLLGVTDADFCCGMRRPGDATEVSNRPTTSYDPNENNNQNKNQYTPHQHLRTHLRGPSYYYFVTFIDYPYHHFKKPYFSFNSKTRLSDQDICYHCFLFFYTT